MRHRRKEADGDRLRWGGEKREKKREREREREREIVGVCQKEREREREREREGQPRRQSTHTEEHTSKFCGIIHK